MADLYPREMLDALHAKNQEMREELEQWRKFGDFDQMVKNVCYMAMVLNVMTANPEWNEILVAIMYKYNNQTEDDLEREKNDMWLRKTLKDMNLE
jgi:hypothetical protein